MFLHKLVHGCSFLRQRKDELYVESNYSSWLYKAASLCCLVAALLQEPDIHHEHYLLVYKTNKPTNKNKGTLSQKLLPLVISVFVQ